MGRISILKPKNQFGQGPGNENPRDLLMRFDEDKLELNIKTLIRSEFSQTVIFIINDISYSVPIEIDGTAVLGFEKSTPRVLYCAKVKDKSPYKNDTRLGFWC